MTNTPAIRMSGLNKSNQGRRSTIGISSVIDPPVYIAKLKDRQSNHDEHENHGLSRRRAQVKALETCVIHLVYEDGGTRTWSTLGHQINDGKGIKKGVDHIDDQQKEGGG